MGLQGIPFQPDDSRYAPSTEEPCDTTVLNRSKPWLGEYRRDAIRLC
ncbi:unnamed protein product [Penicillium roqueforti FM164]|uniref:Genomic scaffold, ProqFM164S01 n=1 Tax=Penicillium roqueforti (strain FM164) TaxID=1365484 RepID=W6PXB1_PENRF|nr:unnamed protein product [Penicillium roqueforti FM164]